VPRARQLKTAKRVFDDDERRKSEALAHADRQLQDCEAKLAELQSYQADYLRDFNKRAGGGMTAASARDYQAFIARLDEALRQQLDIVAQARAQRAEQHGKWRGAAQRSMAVERAVDRHATEEQRALERHEQRDTDERAQRAWSARTTNRAR
jgi:flagellar FliJ protein